MRELERVEAYNRDRGGAGLLQASDYLIGKEKQARRQAAKGARNEADLRDTAKAGRAEDGEQATRNDRGE